MSRISHTLAAALGAALLALGGCASQPHAVDWNRVSLRDQHLYFPDGTTDMRPLVVMASGANGMVVGGGPVPAAQLVMQDGRAMLVSSETATAMRANQTQSLGAGQALPVPPSGVTPQGGALPQR